MLIITGYGDKQSIGVDCLTVRALSPMALSVSVRRPCGMSVHGNISLSLVTVISR